MTLKELINSISKKEWRFVILLSIVLILITTLPYIYAALNAPSGHFWNGIHAITPGDSAVYFSFITQIKDGNWLLQDNFTSEVQSGGLFNLFWLKIGLFAKIFHLSPIWAFQLARIILIPILIIVLYFLTSYFLENISQRKAAMIFLSFASGIGAYFVGLFDKLFPYDPNSFVYKWLMDIWIPDSNIFLSLYQSPHFVFSLTLMVIFFLLIILAFKNNNYRYSLAAGLVALFWFNFHPFYFPYIFAIIFVYLLYLIYKTKKWQLIYHFLLALILALPFVIYHYYKIKTDFVIGQRAAQNVTITPDFLFIGLGFGFLLFMAIVSIFFLLKNKKLWVNEKYMFIVIWLCVGFILVYSPIFFQARFLQGLQIPMVFLTIILFSKLALWFEKKYSRLYLAVKQNYVILGFLFLIFFGFSTFFNLVRDIYYFKTQLPNFYLPKEFVTAVKQLEEDNISKKAVISFEYNANLIPAFANVQTFLSHRIETLYYWDKEKKYQDFFNDQYNAEQLKEFFNDYNLGYLFFSSLERKFSKFNPENKDYLVKIFNQGDIEIYKFIQ
jgi:hypothetical protein